MKHDNINSQFSAIVMEKPSEHSTLIKAYVPNLYPVGTTGKFEPSTQKNTVTILDKNGNPQEITTFTTNYIEATWKGRPNEAYPPNVEPGDRVTIYQYHDTDKFLWESDGRDSQLKTTEKKRIFIGATKKFNQPKDDTNTYFLEFDSISQKVTLKTSKDNGEAFAYIIEINCKNGTVLISDDKGGNGGVNNQILINSKENAIQLTNNDKSSVLLTKENIILQCPHNLTLKSGKQIIFEAPSTTVNSEKLGNTAFVVNAKNVNINTSDNIVFSGSGKMGINNPVKVTKSMVANDMRATDVVYGDIGDSYNATTIDLSDGTQAVASNKLDDDTSGSGNRHAAAIEQLLEAFSKVDSVVSKLCGIHKLSPLNSTSIAKGAKMNNLKSK